MERHYRKSKFTGLYNTHYTSRDMQGATVKITLKQINLEEVSVSLKFQNVCVLHIETKLQ